MNFSEGASRQRLHRCRMDDLLAFPWFSSHLLASPCERKREREYIASLSMPPKSSLGSHLPRPRPPRALPGAEGVKSTSALPVDMMPCRPSRWFVVVASELAFYSAAAEVNSYPISLSTSFFPAAIPLSSFVCSGGETPPSAVGELYENAARTTGAGGHGASKHRCISALTADGSAQGKHSGRRSDILCLIKSNER